MFIKRAKGPSVVRLPDGTLLSRADLPDPATRRWVARRKALVVQAVEHGLLEAEEACALYGLSEEEVQGWRKAMAQHGTRALRVTTIQEYRQP